jgi:murein L,D-transpeptidase YafK
VVSRAAIALAGAVALGTSGARAGFAEDQNNAPRVAKARANKGALVKQRFADAGVAYPPKQLLLRAFKHEGEIEVWASSKRRGPVVRVWTIPVCAKSGDEGPKRQQGDLQVPEGFYVVDRFNAWSSYHLSLGLNYPNRSDRRLGRKPLGGDIFIHGNCVTIGCLPIENGPIEELYVTALDARVAGVRPVRVHVFPRRLTEANQRVLEQRAGDDDSLKRFWRSLVAPYEAFERTREVPRVGVGPDGYYRLDG